MHHFVMLGFSFGVRLHHPEHHPIWIIARSGRVYFFTCFIFGFCFGLLFNGYFGTQSLFCSSAVVELAPIWCQLVFYQRQRG
jgi:hypothetical protein